MSEVKLYKTEFKRWSVEKRMRAADIAEILECSVKTVYAYQQGWRFPSRMMMKRMEERLGIDAREIFK